MGTILAGSCWPASHTLLYEWARRYPQPAPPAGTLYGENSHE